MHRKPGCILKTPKSRLHTERSENALNARVHTQRIENAPKAWVHTQRTENALKARVHTQRKLRKCTESPGAYSTHRKPGCILNARKMH